MKRSLLLFLFIGAVAVVGMAFASNSEDPIEKLVSSLQKWTESNPQEKVYLHMDKPYYAIGDTIWFKAYVTIGSRHQLSAMSGALYVDLINEKDSIISALKLPVTAGMAMGDFTLGDEFSEGNYRIRAYTRWMRNAGADYFYDRTFTVGTSYSYEVVSKANYQYKTINKKPTVIATLNYADNKGNPITANQVNYEIVANHTVIGKDEAKTDKSGNIIIKIINDQKSDLKGAYIRTSIQTASKQKVLRTFPIKAALSQSDVQFFPESGNLVNGITSRVAFKAVGVEGSGIDIKGVVTDNENKEVLSFESGHAGMGTFSLKPLAGKSYKAKITYPDGSESNMDLPKALDQGYVLAVYQIGTDSLLVRINASEGIYQAPRSVNLIAQSGGETVIASQVSISKPLTAVWLLKKDFPTGIAQFTLFSGSGEPLNERIAFIKNKDQMQLEVSTAKRNYKGREKVDIDLESRNSAGDPVPGNFSVSVIDESKVPSDENTESTIFSNILLTSDLKGYVENPNYYFSKETEEVNNALDELMLTQGYRRFIWKEILKQVQPAPVFKAEKLGTEITGRVLTLGGDPVVKGMVTLMSLKPSFLEQVPTDADGRFRFEQIMLTDSIKFAVQARTEKNGKKVEIILDSVPKLKLSGNKNLADINTDINGTIKAYIDNSRKQDSVWAKMGKLNRIQRLKEVVIKAKGREDERATPQGAYVVPSVFADQTYMAEGLEGCPMLGLCLQGKLHGIIFKSLPGTAIAYPMMLLKGDLVQLTVFLDGRRLSQSETTDLFDNNDVNPADILKIQLVNSSSTLREYLNSRDVPVLMVITKRIKTPRYNPGIVNIQPKGFNHAREFYAPRYDNPDANIYVPDLRSTIYWNASIKTNSMGKANFSFFNGDGPGTYKVTIEGIDAAGELCRQVYRYKVD